MADSHAGPIANPSAAPMAGLIAGAVLVGGSSRRMGRDKALIHVDGIAMVDRIGGVLASAGLAPVLAIGPASLAGGLESCEDSYPGEGPLGGVLTALARTAGIASAVCVVACDTPWLDKASIARLIEVASVADADVVIANTDRIEPLCAIWNNASAPTLQQAFADGERAIHRVLGALSVVTVAVPSDVLRNVNTPDDLLSR